MLLNVRQVHPISIAAILNGGILNISAEANKQINESAGSSSVALRAVILLRIALCFLKCCTAWPVSWTATATEEMDLPR